MKALFFMVILTITCGCIKSPSTPEERAHLATFRNECAKKCLPRAVGQLHDVWGREVCGCDVVYLHGEEL